MAFSTGRTMSSKYLVFVCLIVFTIVYLGYLHLNYQIQRIEDSQKKLELALARLQLGQIEHPLELPNTAKSVSDNTVIIYNRVPKTGSTSFMGIAYELCGRNKYNVLHINVTKNLHVLGLSDQVRFVRNISDWNVKKPAIYHGHLSFVDFARLGSDTKPLYINIIRKPLDRLVSYYYFLRYGDDFRPHLIRRKQGDKMTFDDCVQKQGDDCAPENMWLQIPFFCSQMAECWIPGNHWALEQAKYNLVQHYLLVGVTEELSDFIAMLEVTLPRFFHGAMDLFKSGNKSHLRRTSNKIEPLPETVSKIEESSVWKMENEFYEFVLDHFRYIKKKTLMIRDGNLVDKGQQFMYEKIRPK